MLKNLTPQPPDKIIQMIAMFREDPRDQKVDLGVGVYKDAAGKTPVMRAVKAAEARLGRGAGQQVYVGLLGDLGFVDAMRKLVLGNAVPADKVVGAQAPGGTGAIHQLLELVKLAHPRARVWYSDPTWPKPPGDGQASGPGLRHLPLFRRRNARRRFRHDDGGPVGGGGRRRGDPARLLPQPHRRQPRRGTVGAGDRPADGEGRDALHRLCLSGLRRRAGTRTPRRCARWRPACRR